jgi:ribonucleoside-diphosphate reductase beta chain
MIRWTRLKLQWPYKKKKKEEEMLFEEQISRKPDLYPWTKQFVDAIWQGFWTPDEFNFRSDYSQFKSDLSEAEQQVIVRALSAIGQIEVAVKTFWANIGEKMPHPSIRDLGYAMANSEVIHNLAYEKLLEVLQLTHVFEENMNEAVIKGRVDYLRKYLNKVYKNDKQQYIYSIILFTLFVENVSLFSQFYVIMHFNRNRAVLKDCAQQVQYTRNEEMLHAQVGIKLINTLREEYPELFDKELEDRILHECIDSLKAESKVIDWIMTDYAVPGLDATILKAFIAKRMKDSMDQIGFDSSEIVYDKALVDKTFWFDEELYGTNMTDFFQKRPVEYSKGSAITAEDLF